MEFEHNISRDRRRFAQLYLLVAIRKITPPTTCIYPYIPCSITSSGLSFIRFSASPFLKFVTPKPHFTCSFSISGCEEEEISYNMRATLATVKCSDAFLRCQFLGCAREGYLLELLINSHLVFISVCGSSLLVAPWLVVVGTNIVFGQKKATQICEVIKRNMEIMNLN